MSAPINRDLSRREFGAIAVAGAATLATTSQAMATEQNKPGWIDAHVHVWTPDVKRYPLDKNFTIKSMQPKSFTPQQLFAHCKPSGVERIVLIQMSFYRYDNSYMLDTIAKYPGIFSGVGIVDHHQKDVACKMKQLAVKGVRGFRIHSHGDDAKNWVNDQGMANLWKAARKQNLAICPLINPQDVQYIDTLCQKFPGTKVVIDHFARIGVSGKFEQGPLDALCKLARFPTTHVKTSAFYALGKKKAPYLDLIPLIKRLVEAYGPKRLMWASDCPYQVQGGYTYDPAIALIRDRIDFLSEADKQEMLRGTAQRLFF